jgi:pyruvate/2-oxoglutarate dehydrogenase complex dihydrolipoamide acyltransferase (E2) component
LIFLDIARKIQGVTLIDEVKIGKNNLKYATSVLIKSISEAIKDAPHLNCMIKYGTNDKLIKMDEISSRLTVCYEQKGKPCGVYSTVLQKTDNLTTLNIYDRIVEIKERGVNDLDSYRNITLIQKYPLFIGKLATKLMLLLNIKLQKDIFGSFTVTSFGKNSQNLCIPISGSTFTYTLGSPRTFDNELYLLNIVMVFDHRVLDGLEASQLLNRVKENFSFYASQL